MSTTSFCYYKLWKIVKNNRKTTSARDRRIDKQWRAAKATGLLVLFCVASWFPYFMYRFFERFFQFTENYCERNYRQEYVKIGGYFCLLFGCANSSINPFLYYFRNKEVRRGMQLLLKF